MKGRRLLVTLACVALAASLLPFAASSSDNSVRSSAEVSNEHPTNLRITIEGDADERAPGVQIAPSSGKTTVKVQGEAEDGNGWKDLKRVTFEVFAPDGSPLAGADGTGEAEGKGRKRSYSYSFDLPSGARAGTYTVRLSASDHQGAARTAEAVFELQQQLALALDTGTVSFGAGLGPGQTTHEAPASVNVRNVGNVPFDLRVSSDGLQHAGGQATIAPSRLRYSSAADMSGEMPLSASGILDAAFDLAPGATKAAYLDIHMPTGDEQFVPPGRYVGTLVFGGAAE